MEYFKSSLKSVLGTAPAGTQSTGADTVSGINKYYMFHTLKFTSLRFERCAFLYDYVATNYQ